MINIDFEKPGGYPFSIFFANPVFQKILISSKDPILIKIKDRMFRTALLADFLHKKGREPAPEKPCIENEFIALLFESFIFMLRTIYDHMTDVLNKYNVDQDRLPLSFNDLIKGEFREYLIKYSPHFKECKDLRDSLKQKTTSVQIYSKNKTYYVNATYYVGKKSNEKKVLDNKLSQLIFNYSSLFLILTLEIDKYLQKKT